MGKIFIKRYAKIHIENSDRREIYTHQCPLCGERLKAEEKVHSVVYGKGSEKLATNIAEAARIEIYGCPVCYPDNGSVKRLCPVCRHELGAEDFLIGKIWLRNGRKHLHISGCTICLKRP